MDLFTFAGKVFKEAHRIYAAILSLNVGFKYSDYSFLYHLSLKLISRSYKN